MLEASSSDATSQAITDRGLVEADESKEVQYGEPEVEEEASPPPPPPPRRPTLPPPASPPSHHVVDEPEVEAHPAPPTRKPSLPPTQSPAAHYPEPSRVRGSIDEGSSATAPPASAAGRPRVPAGPRSIEHPPPTRAVPAPAPAEQVSEEAEQEVLDDSEGGTLGSTRTAKFSDI